MVWPSEFLDSRYIFGDSNIIVLVEILNDLRKMSSRNTDHCFSRKYQFA